MISENQKAQQAHAREQSLKNTVNVEFNSRDPRWVNPPQMQGRDMASDSEQTCVDLQAERK